ncbi:hypothetical protein CMI37_13770 [Candidatus Pacearchaeota archaeon]|nr:hypothetical protein [Candidatus Pacearchaeota archaeon]
MPAGNDIRITMSLGFQQMVQGLAKVTKALGTLQKELDKNTKSLQKTSKAFETHSRKVAKTSKKNKKNVEQETSAVAKLAKSYQRLAKGVKSSFTPSKGMERGGFRKGGQFESPASRIKGRQPFSASSEGLQRFATAQNQVFSSTMKNITANFSLGKSWAFAKQALAAYLGVMAIKKLMAVAEAVQEINNRIRVTMTSEQIKGGDVKKVFNDLSEAALETRQPFQGMAVMYSRISLASKNLNISQSQVMESTKLFSKLLTIQGATAHEARSALLQFSQSLQAGKLAGDEFRSISEVLPGILRLLAKETGEPIESLKSLAEQGQLTPDLMLRAILRAKGDINSAFSLTVMTINQGMNILQTRFLQFGQAFLGTEEGALILNSVFKILGKTIQVLTRILQIFMLALKAVRTAIEFTIDTFMLGVKGFGKLGQFLTGLGDDAEESRKRIGALGYEFDVTSEKAEELRKTIERGVFKSTHPGQDVPKDLQPTENVGLSDEDANAAINRIKGMDAAYKKFTAEIVDSSNKMGNAWKELFVETMAVTAPTMFGDAVAGMIMEGESLKESMTKIWKDLAKSVIAAIMKMIVQMIIMHTLMAALGIGSPTMLKGSGVAGFFANPMKMLGKWFGGGGAGGAGAAEGGPNPLGTLIPSVLPKSGGILKKLGFATGGPIGAGQLSMVGEEGPELFVPKAAGNIIPNDQLGGRPMIIQSLNLFPHANIDQALMDKPMEYWLDVAQTRILPALNTLGQSGSVTNLTFEEAR